MQNDATFAYVKGQKMIHRQSANIKLLMILKFSIMVDYNPQ